MYLKFVFFPKSISLGSLPETSILQEHEEKNQDYQGKNQNQSQLESHQYSAWQSATYQSHFKIIVLA